MRKTAIALSALVFAFGGAGTAMAQDDPSQRGYDESLGVLGEIGEVNEEPSSQPAAEEQAAAPAAAPAAAAAPQQAAGNDTLPFTGLEAGGIALMGALLVGTGVVLRRSTRDNAA